MKTLIFNVCQVSEAVVPGIEAGFAHRATLAGAMAASPNNTWASPPVNHCAKAPIQERYPTRQHQEELIKSTTEWELPMDDDDGDKSKPEDYMSEYEKGQEKRIQENQQYLRILFLTTSFLMQVSHKERQTSPSRKVVSAVVSAVSRK